MKQIELSNPETEDSPRIVGALKSGEEVFVCSVSHFYTHQDTHTSIKVALASIDSKYLDVDEQGISETEIELEEVGYSICVPIFPTDKFVYAKRKPRTWYTRFVVGKEPIETHIMSIILQFQKDKFEMLTCYWGPSAEREPSDPGLTPGSPEYLISEDFWKKRALILPGDDASMMALGIDSTEVKEVLPAGEEYFRS